MKTQYFKLFANCLPVKGARRSIVCDLQRHTYDFIPNDLYALLMECNVKPFDEIRGRFAAEDLDVFDEYFTFLTQKEYGFYCTQDELSMFPDLPMDFAIPSVIANAVIDISAHSDYDFADLFQQLDELGCKHLHIRFFDPIRLSQVEDMLKMLHDRRIRSVQLVLQYTDELEVDLLKRLCKRYLRVIHLVVAGSPERSNHHVGVDDYTSIDYVTQAITSCESCGMVHHAYFAVDISLFTESKNHNNCLNRKLGIDIHGEIKNCPSMKKSFGNIRHTKLKSVVVSEDFSGLWNVTKDQVKGCMDCEFRYICTDCRAYLSDEQDPFSKPAKCAYDPYTAEWKN